MLNLKLIYKIIGSLLFLEAGFLLICLGISIFYMEDDILAFLLSFIVMIAGGIIFRYAGRNAANNLGRRDAYLLECQFLVGEAVVDVLKEVLVYQCAVAQLAQLLVLFDVVVKP
ncbi:MAG: hypothetical protein IKH64_01275 [Prevotella sp.]|nr:hypothetical protein [Prevotella sp.]